MIRILRKKLLAAPALVRARTRDNAFTYRMPYGIPGDVNRAIVATIEPNLIDVAAPPLQYGDAVVLAGAAGIRPVTTGDAIAAVYGALVRPFPFNQQTTSSFFGSNPLGTQAVPPASGIADVLKQGYMTVLLRTGTAVAGTKVYIWTAASSGAHVIGGYEATDPGGSGIAAPAYFRGAADANGNVEIAWGY